MIRTQRNITKGYVNGVGSFLGVDPDFDDIEGVEAWAVDTIARCGTLDAEYSTHKGPCNETHPTFEEVLETIEAVPPKKVKWETAEPEPEVVETTPAQHDFTALDEYFSRPRPSRPEAPKNCREWFFDDAPEVVPDPVKEERWVYATWADNASARVAAATADDAFEGNIDFVMAHTGVDRDAAIQYLNRKP